MKPAFGTRGQKSAGVSVQYGGTTGQVENCQVGVFLAYVTAKGHTLIDRELSLPFDWREDRERCQAAHIPQTVRFQTKPELAIQMLERIFQAHLPITWVVADTLYGGNLDLRTWCEQHQYSSVLAVGCPEPVGIVTPDGRHRWVDVGEGEALVLQDQDWQRLSMKERACQRWWQPLAPAFISRRMRENAKDLGLDHYEVRSFLGWYRHVTLVLLALAYLAGICATAAAVPAGTAPSTRHPLLPLTIPEVRHLLARLIWPLSSSLRLSCWPGRGGVAAARSRGARFAREPSQILADKRGGPGFHGLCTAHTFSL